MHIAVALVAYALFVVAALQALLLIGLEKRLHRGLAPPDADGVAPPLLTLERFLFRLVGAGFVLLTLTLASGFVFSEQLFGKPADVHAQERVLGGRLAHLRGAAVRRAGATAGAAGARCTGSSPAPLLLVLGYLGSKFVVRSPAGADR